MLGRSGEQYTEFLAREIHRGSSLASAMKESN
jgi:hypothetical protein